MCSAVVKKLPVVEVCKKKNRFFKQRGKMEIVKLKNKYD
jgi:hypothetical protein